MTAARVFPQTETRRYLPLTRVYSSGELATLTGMTLRTLQSWDERRIAQASRDGWARAYTPSQTLLAMVIADLRSKRVTVYSIRPVLRILRQLVDLVLYQPAEKTPYLLVGRRSAQLFDDAKKAVAFLESSRVPVYVVNLPEKRRRMEMLEETCQK